MFSLALADLPGFNKLAIVLINIAVVTLLVTVFRYGQYKDQKSRIFAAMSIFMLMWVDFAYLARLLGEGYLTTAEWFLRLAWVATPMLFYFTYLASAYVALNAPKRNALNISLFVVAVVLSLSTAFTDIIIEGIKFTGVNLDIQYGVGFYPFLVLIFLFMVLTLVPVMRAKITRTSGSFLIGVLIFYIANIVFNIALPVLGDITHLYYFGDYSTIILIAFTAYAIIEFKLFSIRVVATQALTVVLWIVLIARLFVASTSTQFFVDLFVFFTAFIFGLLFLRSVREEALQKKRLEDLAVRLRETDKQKDEFINVAAHELRAPMTAIKGYLSMIAEGDAGTITDETAEYLEDAIIGNDRLIRIVNNMLNVARIEEGRLVYQINVVHLTKIVNTVYDEFKLEAKDKNLGFEVTIADNISDKIKVDEDRIHEVAANLVSNSIKYTERGTVKIFVSNPMAGIVKCEIADTGPGISRKDAEKLFNKFYRAESAIGKAVGSGLGLYISKLLVHEFGGKIGFHSQMGKGTTFWFELPLVSGTT